MVKEAQGNNHTGAELVARVKKFREVQSLQHESIPNVAETLERIRKFLQEHETPSSNDNTHAVFDNYQDWWVGSKPSFKLAIAEDNTIELLHKYISELFSLGVPLTLAERRTPEIRFVQDLCIWGTNTEAVRVDELMGSERSFAQQLGRCLGEVYPQMEFLDVVIFDATGMSKTKGVMKTSVRLVWSGIIVDKDRALRIHDYVVSKFKESTDDELKTLAKKVLEFNPDNQWNSIFNAEVYQGRHCIRMPLCDRVSPSPMKGPEHRPFVPFGVVRFTYQGGQLDKTETIVERDGLDGHEWINIGSVRRDTGTPLTDWTQPVWKGERPSARTHYAPGYAASGFTSPAATVAVGGRSSGQVKVRTRNGSDEGPRAPRQPRHGQPVTQERIMHVEREFDGTAQEFREKLEAQLGLGQDEHIHQDEAQLTWRQAGDTGAQIVFKPANRRVYISGKVHQVRSLLSVISSFARGVGESARSMTQTQRSRGPASQAGQSGYQASFAPSAVYAPSNAPSQAFSSFSTGRSSNAGAREFQPTQRIVTRNFEPQGTGELKLTEGDRVTVTHDPEEGNHNVHRWVYGQNNTTGERGWFPMSHAAQEAGTGANADNES